MARESSIDVPSTHPANAAVNDTPGGLRDGDHGGNGVPATQVDDKNICLLIYSGILSVTRVVEIGKARSCRKDTCDGATDGTDKRLTCWAQHAT